MKRTVAAHSRSSSLLGVVVIFALVTNTASADLRSTFGQLLNPPTSNPPRAVARIYAKESGALSSGSGTLVHVDAQFGYVLTNWHVVRDAEGGQIIAQFPDGSESAATILKMDEKWDLALLRIWKPNIQPLSLSTTVPVIGEPLTIMGYGSGKFRAARGVCKYYASPDRSSPSEMIEVSTAARQGDSGGPVLNTRGEVAAVLFGSGRGVTTGTHIGRVVEFLNSIDLSVDDRNNTKPATDHIADEISTGSSEQIAERVIDEKRAKQASLVAEQARSGNENQYYQLPPLEWSTVDDDSTVVAAAAQVATDTTLVAQNPQPRVAKQFRSAPRLSLTIEPFEPEIDSTIVPELEIELPEPAAMRTAAPTQFAPQSPMLQSSGAPTIPGQTAQPPMVYTGPNILQPASVNSRTTINQVDPIAAQNAAVYARTAPHSAAPYSRMTAPTGFSQPQFSAHGSIPPTNGFGSNSFQQLDPIEMPRLNLRKLFAIAQSILAIVGIVTLLEKFRR